MRRGVLSVLIAAGGLLLNPVALFFADRHSHSFPTISDILMDRLPLFDLSAFGELYLFLYVVAFVVAYSRQSPRNWSYVLLLVGIFYAARGLFLLLLPIGPPAMAPPGQAEHYPFAEHSYFPSGHSGLMSVLALVTRPPALRRWFMVALVVFAAGTVLTKAHYTADNLGGFLLAYATYAWGERRLKRHWVDVPKLVASPGAASVSDRREAGSR